MKHLASAAIAAALGALTVLPAHAAPNAAVTDGWFRALPSNLPAGGYFTLHNKGSSTLTLNGAASQACGMLMLHRSTEMGGMSHMEDVSSVDVPPGGEVKFAPGGYHLMCMNPAAEMKPGGTVKVTLKFANGETLESDFAVRNAAGK